MRNLTLLIFIFSLTGCFNSTQDRPTVLFRQRIADSKYVIYEFSYPGPFVTSGEFRGLTVLDSNYRFSKDKIALLPCEYFRAKPTDGRLKMIDIISGPSLSTPKDTSLVPAKKYHFKLNGFDIDVAEYKETYGSAIGDTGLKEYRFENFKETKDSLIFFKIKKRLGRNLPPRVSFLKGNIKIIESANKQVDHIEINELIITRGAIYKPTKPLELVPNQPITGIVTYYFFPDNKTSSDSFTDFGIYKDVLSSLK